MKLVVATLLILVAAWHAGAQQPAQPKPDKHEPQAQAPAPQTIVRDDAGIVSTRSTWPLGVPLYVSINWGPFADSKAHKLKFLSDLQGAPAIEDFAYSSGTSCVMAPVDMTWDDRMKLAGTPAQVADSVAFRVSVADPEGKDAKAGPKPTGPFKVPVRIKGSVDDVLTAVALPDVDAALVKELNAHFYRRGWNSRGAPRLWLGTYTNCEGAVNTQYPGICHVLAKHPDVTFAVRVEVVHEGRVVAWSSAWWRGDGHWKSVTPFEGMLSLEDLDKGLGQLDIKDGKWSLHIKSDPNTALRDFESSQYWKGDVVAPVRVTDSRDWNELVANGEDKKP